MEFLNLNKFLNDYAKNIEDIYKGELQSRNYRIAESVNISVNILEHNYQIVMKLDDYWKWIENGRKPGKMPPISAITKWIKDKNIKPREPNITEKQLSFLIARKIGMDGIKPKNLFKGSVELATTTDFKTELINAWKKDVKEWNLKYIKITD